MQGASAKHSSVLVQDEPLTCTQCTVQVGYYACCCCALEFCFKKICFFLTVKECVETVSEMLHEGLLLEHALKEGLLVKETLQDENDLWRVRAAILQTCDNVDTSPLHKAVKNVLDVSN